MSECPIFGDLNGDTAVNIQDIVMLIDLLFSIHLGYEPTDQELELADINFDGNLNVIDVVALVNMVLDQ